MKVLLADSDADRATAIERALGGVVVVRVDTDQGLREAVERHAPDVVLIDMMRADRDALEGIRQLSQREPLAIALFVDHDDPDFMQAAIDAGISSYTVVGTALPDVKSVLRAAVALFERHRTTARTLDDRTIVDRAKAHLIRTRAMSEPDAYRWLRRRAMDRGRRIAEIATGLLDGSEH